MNEREQFIVSEFKCRIAALKAISTTFDVDGICFFGSSLADQLTMIGDVKKLAALVGKEVYEGETREGKGYKAFEYDGIEVVKYD